MLTFIRHRLEEGSEKKEQVVSVKLWEAAKTELSLPVNTFEVCVRVCVYMGLCLCVVESCIFYIHIH